MPQNANKQITLTSYNQKRITREAKNKTQVLHQLRLRQFTARQPIPNIQILPLEWKPDPEVIIKHDDLYAIARECDYDKATFHSDYNNLVTPNSPEITVWSEEAADERSSTPETIRKNSPQIFPQTDTSCDGMDTDHYMKPDSDTSIEQPGLVHTNPAAQNMIYVIFQGQIVMTKTDIEPVPLPSTERIRKVSGNPRNVLWNWYAKSLHILSSA